MRLLLFIGLIILADLGGSAQQFHRADSIAKRYQDFPLTNLKALSDSLTMNLSGDLEKYRAIFYWVTHNISNDYYLYAQNKHKRLQHQQNPVKLASWNESLNERMFKKLLKERSTVCTGYAYLVKELAYHAGIKCEIINGFGRTGSVFTKDELVPNHSWNAVQLNGKWYLSDPTWASGVVSEALKIFIPQFAEGYFLTEPSLFAWSHYPQDSIWLLGAEVSFESFVQLPIVYHGAFNHHLMPVSPVSLQQDYKKGEPLKITFECGSEVNVADIQVIKSAGSTQQIVSVKSENFHENQIQITLALPHKEKFWIHIRYKGEEVVSYQMRVS